MSISSLLVELKCSFISNICFTARNQRLLAFLLPKAAKGIKKALCCVARLSDLKLTG